MKLDLRKLGEHEGKLPLSMATCLDFVSLWGSDLNRAHLGRLSAAAIAVALDHKRVLPAYNVATGDPIKFGHKVLDRLLEAGVSVGSIYEMGSLVLTEMLRAISFEEAEEKANFSQGEEG